MTVLLLLRCQEVVTKSYHHFTFFTSVPREIIRWQRLKGFLIFFRYFLFSLIQHTSENDRIIQVGRDRRKISFDLMIGICYSELYPDQILRLWGWIQGELSRPLLHLRAVLFSKTFLLIPTLNLLLLFMSLASCSPVKNLAVLLDLLPIHADCKWF